VEINVAGTLKLVEAVEAPIAKPIADAGAVAGKFVYLGLASAPLTEEQIASVKGNVALIDRGLVTFGEKIKRAAEAGAIGVVVANNQDGEPFSMGGDGKFEIPAIMITKALGEQIKAALTGNQAASINFQTEQTIEKPELIDNLTDFSSKGPRSSDGVIKPDISSPGANIISADMGAGAKGAKLSGTSMAGPHVAGVMALLRQAHPALSPLELKSILMGSAKTIADKSKVDYPVSRQGSGRVQIVKAIQQKIISMPASVSLGETQIEKKKTFRREITYKNISTAALTANLIWDGDANLDVKLSQSQLSLEPGASLAVQLIITADASKIETADAELDGWVKVMSEGVELQRVPVLLNAHKLTQITASNLQVFASAADAAGARATVDVKNLGVHDGEVYLFNSLGVDERKTDLFPDKSRNRECDVQGAGYKIVTKTEAGKAVDYYQFAVKLYEPMTTWNTCELNVQIDTNNDGLADQELAGVPQERLKGLTPTTFATLLLDATKARELRKQFEADTLSKKEDAQENYSSAVQGIFEMKTFLYSTIAVIEVPVSELK
ncbi:MAG: S8 family serine peptidase, partial [Pseudobdellovibrionaceae bacterium]